MLDILSITMTGSRYNLHGHTQFCDGHAPMEHFVRQALDERFTHYGFTPHAPTTVQSTCNMSRDDVPRFLDEVRRLRLPDILCRRDLDGQTFENGELTIRFGYPYQRKQN